MKIYYRLSLLILTLLVFSCKKEPVIVGSAAFADYPAERRLTIGNAIDVETKRAYNTIAAENKPEAIAYINKILSIVVTTPTVTTRTTFNWAISIIDDASMATAFTVPNGHIYISSGLLNFLESESQLLSLLAHEIAYAERDYMTLALEDEFGKEALGDIILDNGLADVEEMALILPSLKFDDAVVLDADDFSVELLCDFDYEPRGIVKIVEKSSANPNLSISWLDKKYAESSTRIELMNNLSEPCGLDGVKNEEAYQAFLQDLF